MSGCTYLRRIPHAHKTKLAPHPQTQINPHLKRGIMEVSCRKNQQIPGAHKIGVAISGSRIAGGKSRTLGFFWISHLGRNPAWVSTGFGAAKGPRNSTPDFSTLGVSDTSHGTLRGPKRLSEALERLQEVRVCPSLHSSVHPSCDTIFFRPRVPRKTPEIIIVGTKVIEDPDKCLLELISQHVADFIAGEALSGMNSSF